MTARLPLAIVYALPAGVHAPGAPIGIQTIYGHYLLSSSGTLRLQIRGPAAGTQHSRVSVRGGSANTVTLDGALAVVASPGIATNTTFIIVENDGADPVSGTFAGLPNNATFSASGYTWRVNYYAGDGNDVGLTAIARHSALLGVTIETGVLQLTWPAWAEQYSLWSATNLALPSFWQLVTNGVTSTNSQWLLTVPAAARNLFFQLRWP